MDMFGLIGYPLSHSFSVKYFEQKFAHEQIQAVYKNFEIDTLNKLLPLIENHQLKGFNVTLPYKEKIIPYLTELDDSAAIVGAVNCVKVRANKRIGYNTDIAGFEKSLSHLFAQHSLNMHDYKALVFGTGGASKAVCHVLQKYQIPYLIVSRTPLFNSISYLDINQTLLSSHRLLINTTPVGMYPLIDECLPLPYQFITPQHIAYDLIYNPAKTTFLVQCEQRTPFVKNGLEMLEIQAELSYKLFIQV